MTNARCSRPAPRSGRRASWCNTSFATPGGRSVANGGEEDDLTSAAPLTTRRSLLDAARLEAEGRRDFGGVTSATRRA